MGGPGNGQTEPRWVAPEDCELHWDSWGEYHAVYDARSGDTHLLPQASARVLQQLVRSPGTVQEVTQALCSRFNERYDDSALARNGRLIRQLHGAGLVENTGT